MGLLFYMNRYEIFFIVIHCQSSHISPCIGDLPISCQLLRQNYPHLPRISPVLMPKQLCFFAAWMRNLLKLISKMFRIKTLQCIASTNHWACRRQCLRCHRWWSQGLFPVSPWCLLYHRAPLSCAAISCDGFGTTLSPAKKSNYLTRIC